MIFESHAHYDDERFDKDRADILGNIGSAFIGSFFYFDASYDHCLFFSAEYFH